MRKKNVVAVISETKYVFLSLTISVHHNTQCFKLPVNIFTMFSVAIEILSSDGPGYYCLVNNDEQDVMPLMMDDSYPQSVLNGGSEFAIYPDTTNMCNISVCSYLDNHLLDIPSSQSVCNI